MWWRVDVKSNTEKDSNHWRGRSEPLRHGREEI